MFGCLILVCFRFSCARIFQLSGKFLQIDSERKKMRTDDKVDYLSEIKMIVAAPFTVCCC